MGAKAHSDQYLRLVSIFREYHSPMTAGFRVAAECGERSHACRGALNSPLPAKPQKYVRPRTSCARWPRSLKPPLAGSDAEIVTAGDLLVSIAIRPVVYVCSGGVTAYMPKSLSAVPAPGG